MNQGTNSSVDNAPYPWQKQQWDIFINQLQQKKLSHAYLLYGIDGIGKAEFATIIAKWILCEKNNPNICNSCKSCSLLATNTHPDFIVLQPEKKNAEIKIDQIRSLHSIVYQTAKLSGYKVVILFTADKLNNFAANALLKSLEEPGENTIFMLVSSKQSNLLPTIRTRCQRVVFTKPATAIAIKWLSDKISERQKIIDMLTINNGSPLLALDCYKNQQDHYKEFTIDISAMFTGKKSIVELAKKWHQKQEVYNIITWMIIWLNNSIILAVTNNKKLLTDVNSYPIASFFIKKNNLTKLFNIRDKLVEHLHIIIKHPNVNLQLLMETIFCRYLELVVHTHGR